MTRLADARVLTRRQTGYEFPEIDADQVGAIIAEKVAARDRSSTVGAVSTGEFILVSHTTSDDISDVRGVSGSVWPIMGSSAGHDYWVRTKTTSVTSTTVSTVGMLLRACGRDEMLKRLSPERRATFDRIRKLREEMGAISFNIVRELRELRSRG